MTALTRDDITAMRMADDVSLHLYGITGSIIRAYVQGRGEPIIYSESQQRLYPEATNFHDRRARDIATEGSVTGYGEAGSFGFAWNTRSTEPGPSCFYSVHDRDVWTTITQTLRVGDELHVHWRADNNTDTIRQANLHADEVRLIVRHEGKPNATYRVGNAITPDNSARMVRRYG
jgi:hypothetical protein